MDVLIAPVGGKLPRTRCRENRLPKSLEDARYSCESRLRRVHTAQQFFQLRYDASLFVERREGKGQGLNITCTYVENA